MEQNGGNLVRWKRAKPNAEIYEDGARTEPPIWGETKRTLRNLPFSSGGMRVPLAPLSEM